MSDAEQVNVKSFEPGNELDAIVAQEVMHYETRIYQEGVYISIPGKRGFDAGPWSPSTNLKDAWEVLETVGEKYGFLIVYRYNNLWSCELSGVLKVPPGDVWSVARTVELAICQTALKVAGGKSRYY